MKLTFQKANKRPTLLDVLQLTNEIWDEIYAEDSHDIQINGYTVQAAFVTEERKVFYINTLEDVSKEQLHKAEINDWLIVGVKGEIYACANDIFEETYTIRDSLMDFALEDSGYPNL